MPICFMLVDHMHTRMHGVIMSHYLLPYACAYTMSFIDIHLAVVGTHAAHTSAKLAMEGEYTEARVNAFSRQRLLQRTRYSLALLPYPNCYTIASLSCTIQSLES